MERNFLGRGWHFPLRVNARGGIALTSGEEDIEEAIRIILETERGERLMRPLFGSEISELIFSPMNGTTFGRLDQYVREALRLWEPRIDVIDVKIEPDHEHQGRLNVNIFYRIKESNDERNLVFPYYLIPEEEE